MSVKPTFILLRTSCAQDPRLGQDVARRFRAKSYAGPMAQAVDLALLVRAGFLVGNPASTFTDNAVRARCAMRPLQPSANLWCMCTEEDEQLHNERRASRAAAAEAAAAAPSPSLV